MRPTAAESATSTGCSNRKSVTAIQIEVPDDWLKDGNPFEVRRDEYACEVKFGGYVKTEWRDGQKLRYVQEGYQSVPCSSL